MLFRSSLFAKLYLVLEEKVIFIIDEPELSLSIIWQEMLIKDIYESGKVSLLISTTHSPFIFRNELFEYARELRNCRYETFYIEERSNGFIGSYEKR